MNYTNSQIKALIVEHIHSQRDRKILYRRMVDGITYERLAEEFSLSPSQIKRIIYKAEQIIFQHFPG
jgi:DNA-directed RNA polymerase specialized sigma24 family protein